MCSEARPKFREELEEQRESLSCGDLPWVDDCLCDRCSVGHRPTGVQLARLEHLSRARARKWPFLNGKNHYMRWPPRRSGSGSPPEGSFRPPPFPNSPCNLPCFEFRPVERSSGPNFVRRKAVRHTVCAFQSLGPGSTSPSHLPPVLLWFRRSIVPSAPRGYPETVVA